ncbi:MAG: MATE family efflux transporter [Myxococcales bacterium]|nr:MAG: MATE family efflux transporter [Myxococcales bacterium]
MTAQRHTVDELKRLIQLALPLATFHFGTMTLGAVDTAVVGRLGEIELGAVGMGHAVFFVVTVLGSGIMMGLDPLLAQAIGAEEHAHADRLRWQGMWIAILLSIPLGVVIALLTFKIESFGLDVKSAEHTRAYLFARLPGLLPLLVFSAWRSFLQAHSHTKPLMIAILLANIINIPASWYLVFGDQGMTRFGLPAIGFDGFGVAGAAWASTLCIVVQLVWVSVSIHLLEQHKLPQRRAPEMAIMRRIATLGTPIGLQLLAEFGVFTIVHILMANLGPRALASHHVAITFAAATFNLALGIGAAASVMVGNRIGAGDTPSARRAGFIAIATSTTVMATASLLFWTLPEFLAAWLTNQQPVIHAAGKLLMIAAIFQLSDGIQAVAAGALRGAGDTRIPLLSNLVGHYLIGLPVGVALAFVLGWGAQGLWWGLSAGLTAVALFLLLRFHYLSSSEIQRS